MPEPQLVSGVAIKVDGTQLTPEKLRLLTLAHVEESVQLPDYFTLRFGDPHFEIFDDALFKMGSEVEIAFSNGGDLTVVTKGEVTAISIDQREGRHELVIEGLDVAHRLHRGPKSRTFNQMTDADIVGQVAGDYGFSTDVDGTNEVYDYVIQSNQSDFAFLEERAGRIGFDVWIAEGALHFKETPRATATPPALKWGDNLTRFKVRFSSTERCDEVTVRGWDPVAKTAIVGKASKGDSGTTAPGAKELSDEAKSAFGSVSRAAGQFPVSTQAEADALAESLVLRASGGEVVARGEAMGEPLLAAGATVEVAAMGRRLSGEYRLTSVDHVYSAGAPYVTRFMCGPKESSGLVDVMGGAKGAGWGSLVLATVTNAEDPDKLGRVKVKFVDLEETESHWAFVVSPGAGAERGLQLTPEVGDTVVVGFEHDDHRRPLVLGGLWSSTDKPPNEAAVNGGKTESRLLKSREGHLLEFLDDGTGKVTLELKDGKCQVVLAESETSLLGAKKLKIDGQDIEITAKNKLVLKGAQVEINSSGPAKVTGKPIQLN